MSRQPIPDDIKMQVADLYKKNITCQAIANLLGISLPSVTKIISQYVKQGILEPKKANFGKHRLPNGTGSKYIKKGYNPHNKKLTIEQEKELLRDYFEKDMTYKQIMAKYGLWQGSIKIIVDKAITEGLYMPKGYGGKKKIKEND